MPRSERYDGVEASFVPEAVRLDPEERMFGPRPPAPVPGPATFDAPCVGDVPWRGVSLVAIFGGRGITIGGLGATTGVASLLMFLGADPPSFSFGFACC